MKEAVQQPPVLREAAGIVMANWYWKVVGRFVLERFGIEPEPQQLPELAAPFGICLQAAQEASAQG